MFTKKKDLPKHSKDAWYVELRGSYYPVSWQGWFLYIPYIMYIALVFMLVMYGDDQPLTTKVIILIPYLVSGLVIMTWVAKQKS